MKRVSVVINSKEPNIEWLKQCLDSCNPFDEIILYVDGCNFSTYITPSNLKIVSDEKSRSISEGFNFAAKHSTGDWIVPFCDDDYFYKDNLLMLLDLLHMNAFDDADIINFPVMVNGGYQWGTHSEFSVSQIEAENLIPHGCFIRREAFEKLEGYRIDEGADWNMWIRAKRMGLRFVGFKNPVYYFRHGHERSALIKQTASLGGAEALRQKVLANA